MAHEERQTVGTGARRVRLGLEEQVHDSRRLVRVDTRLDHKEILFMLLILLRHEWYYSVG